MSRAHVEFIQSQALPWQKGLHGEGRDYRDSKILSIDNGTGACTAVVRYPPGWAREAPEHLLADEEFLVLDGELTINGRPITDITALFRSTVIQHCSPIFLRL